MKILHRFCSEEVMTLIERMDTFPDEFVDSDKWNDFLPQGMHNRNFNYVERLLVQSAWDRLKDNYLPRRSREAIIKTLMYQDKKPSSLLTTATITQQALDLLDKQLKQKHYAAGYMPTEEK